MNYSRLYTFFNFKITAWHGPRRKRESMKVKDIVLNRNRGVIHVFNEEEVVSVMASHKMKLNHFLECDVVSVYYHGASVDVEIL